MNKKGSATFLRKLTNPRVWAYGLFWSWNIIFLAFMFLGFAPRLLPEMITAVRTDIIPTAFLVYAAILTVIPALAVILGLTVLRRSPGRHRGISAGPAVRAVRSMQQVEHACSVTRHRGVVAEHIKRLQQGKARRIVAEFAVLLHHQ